MFFVCVVVVVVVLKTGPIETLTAQTKPDRDSSNEKRPLNAQISTSRYKAGRNTLKKKKATSYRRGRMTRTEAKSHAQPFLDSRIES